jgi:competence protein ComEC
MPAGLLGLAAMPFGLDGIFWRLMDFGIEWMIVVTQWVAALPGAIGHMAAFGTGPLVAATAGIILLGLLRTPLRWSGAAIIGLAIAWSLAVKQPDILVSTDGRNVGVRGGDGRLRLIRTGKDAFTVKEWLAADADWRPPADPTLAEGVSCDEAGCVVQVSGGGVVALARRPDAMEDDCVRAAVMVTAWQAPEGCLAQVIDQDQLRREGTLVLRRTSGDAKHHFVVDAVRPEHVSRPWSPAIGDEKPVRIGTRSEPARSIDATPATDDLQPDD